LKAKLEFIESKYDYSSAAKQMSINDFKELIESNLSVNKTVDAFTSNLDNIKKEI
jgi:cytidylate kinase